MPKKSMENLRQAHDAVNRFKKHKDQDPGNNEIYSKTVLLALLELYEKEHKEVQKVLGPNKGKPSVKPNLPEN